MSSRLVKKGLDFVSSTNESIQKKQKGSQRNKKRIPRKRRHDVLCQGLSSSQKAGKKHKKDDFTEQNLKYFKHSAWSMKKDTYEKIVEHHEKRPEKKEKLEDTQDEDELY